MHVYPQLSIAWVTVYRQSPGPTAAAERKDPRHWKVPNGEGTWFDSCTIEFAGGDPTIIGKPMVNNGS